MALRKHILVFLIFFIGVFHIFASDANYTIYSIGNEGTTCKFEDTRVNAFIKIQMDHLGSVRGLPLNE